MIDAPPQPPRSGANGGTPEQTRQLNRHQRRGAAAVARVEAGAIKDIAGQINATAQLAVRALHAVATRELTLSRIDGRAASLVICHVPEGKDLDPVLGEQMARILGLDLVSLPAGITLETVAPERLAALGWTKAPTPPKDADQP